MSSSISSNIKTNEHNGPSIELSSTFGSTGKLTEKLFHDPNCKKVKFIGFVDVSTIQKIVWTFSGSSYLIECTTDT